MPHPLLQQLDSIRQRARRLVLLRAGAQVLAAVCLTTVGLAAIDCLLRIEDRGTRTLLTILWLLASGAAVWFWLLPVLRMQWNLESVARMVERQFPVLQDRLSSAIAFLHQCDDEMPYGSQVLMRNVIAETTSDAAALNLGKVLDDRPTRRSFAALACAIMVGAVALFANPVLGPLAARRLLLPWQDAPWPRMHHLRFVQAPTRIARGSDLLLVVDDASGRPPQRVELQLMDRENRRIAESQSMARRGDQFILERKNITRTFRYRACGGDDTTMPWREMQVVEPPTILSGRTKLVPPRYTGWLPQTQETAVGGLRVFQGTQVSLEGVADRPLTRVDLKFEARGALEVYSSKIDNEARRFYAPSPSDVWQIEEPGEYQLHLVGTDETQTVNAERWSVRVVPDLPPTMNSLDPIAEEWITSTATVRLRLEAKDDLGVKAVDLHFMRSDQSESGEAVVHLYQGPAQLPSREIPVDLQFAADEQEVSYEWSLAELQLTEGSVLSFYASAEDYKGQRIQRSPRKLTVLTELELTERVARRHSLVLARLQQRLDQQRQIQQHIEAVSFRLGETETIDKAMMDRLQSALLGQRQVNASLAAPDASIAAELQSLQRVLTRSHITDGKTQQSVYRTLETLDQVAQSHLGPAMDSASEAQQSLQAEVDRGKSRPTEGAKRSLSTAESHQANAIQSLEDLLDEMSSWDNYRRIGQDLGELLRQQNEVREQTEAVARQTLSRATRELDGEQRAATRSIASRQLELARRTERIIANLAKIQQKLGTRDPDSEESLRDAMETARELAVAGRMRQAGKMIGDHRLGSAADEQQAATRAIEEMLDQLSRRSYTSEESEQRMQVASRDLQRLRNRQQQLSDAYRKAGSENKQTDRARALQRLTKRQQQQSREMETLQRKLERLRALDAAESMQQSQASSAGAASAAEEGSALAASGKSKQAEAQMDQAEQHLQERMERIKSRLVAEQMTKLPQRIEAVTHRQEAVNREVVRLNELRTNRGEWTAGMQASVSLAAETERTLATDTLDLSASVAQLPAYAFGLQESAISMGELVATLEQGNTGDQTQTLGWQIVDELKAMLETMEQDKRNSPDANGAGQGSGGDDSGGNREDFEPSIAQLKLLRQMQLRINQETERISQTQATDSRSQKIMDQKLSRIAERQGRLAKIVAKLYRPAEEQSLVSPAPTAESDGLNELDSQLDLLLR